MEKPTWNFRTEENNNWNILNMEVWKDQEENP
jgi:hypothetical protein